MKISIAASILALASGAYAGLEDAKFSTVLTPANFQGQIASQSEGTLVAFFAPWCGHCKSLEPVWTKVAEAFDGDDRCKVAHFNADDASAKPLASKYGVSGFPTLKFIRPNGVAEDYKGARSEDALLGFLNENCGTHKLPGGLLGDLAGRIPSLDSLASLLLTPTATRPALLSSASALAASLTDSSSSLASYYIKIFTKYQDLAEDSVDDAKSWIENERIRLGKIASKKGNVAVKQIEEARMKQNILAAFASASASASSLSSVASETASSVSSVASETASSLASVASETASSLSSVASESASSVVSGVSSGASSLSSVAAYTASAVYDSASAYATSISASGSSVYDHAASSASSQISVAYKSGSSAASAASKSGSSYVSPAVATASSAASVVSSVVDDAASTVSSYVSPAISTASSVADAAASSASSAASVASKSGASVAGGASSAVSSVSSTVSSVVASATGRVREEL